MDTAQRRALGLVALSAWLLIDSVRAAGPLLSDLFDIGVTVAAGVGVGTFLLGAVLAWVASLTSRRAAPSAVLITLTIATVGLRLLLPPLTDTTLIAAGLVTAALALALVITAARIGVGAGGGPTVLVGTALGAVAALVEQAMLRTWDAVWRDDWLGWVSLIGVGALAVVNAWRCRDLETAPRVRGWWVLGLTWSLLLYAFANVAFANSQTTLRMSLGLTTAALGLLAGAWLASRPLERSLRVAAAVLAPLTTAVVMFAPGAAAAIALPVASASVIVSASLALRAAGTRALAGRDLGGYAAFALLTLLPFMLVQLDYDIPLGFRHVTVVVAAALGVGLAALPRRDATPALTGVRRRVGIGIVVVGAAAVYTFSVFELPKSATTNIVLVKEVVSWNLHYGVTPGTDGGPDVGIDQIAQVLREQSPQIMLLQEVDRGWILAGGVDILEYLAGELGVDYAYAPAHDPQFGNAVLAHPHVVMTDPRVIVLPYGDGPQGRSAIAVTTASGTFVSAHLQHKERDQTRKDEADVLIAALAGDGPIVVGGDFNATDDSAAISAFQDAGYTSAQDLFGVRQDTYVGADFQARIDYVWGKDVTFATFAILDEPWSDHLPLRVELAINP